jgi:hypothetical protein
VLTISDVPCSTLISALALGIFAAGVQGQRPSREDQHLALIGLTDVDARVIVQWDMEVTMRGGTTLSDFERSLKSAFELGLHGTGVRINETSSARVDCVVSLTYTEKANPTVLLSRTIRLFRPSRPEERLGPWIVGWSRGETRETDRDALSGSEVGRDCAAAFGQAWRRANRKSGW